MGNLLCSSKEGRTAGHCILVKLGHSIQQGCDASCRINASQTVGMYSFPPRTLLTLWGHVRSGDWDAHWNQRYCFKWVHELKQWCLPFRLLPVRAPNTITSFCPGLLKMMTYLDLLSLGRDLWFSYLPQTLLLHKNLTPLCPITLRPW